MNPLLVRQLLDPKAAAKERKQKRTPNYVMANMFNFWRGSGWPSRRVQDGTPQDDQDMLHYDAMQQQSSLNQGQRFDFINPQQTYYHPPAPFPQGSSIQPATADYPGSRTYNHFPAPSPHQPTLANQDLTETGPQQSRKPTTPATPDSNDVRASLPKWDAKALLNPNSAKQSTNGTATPAAGASAAENEQEDGATGMSRFMNDLHRTTERQAVSHKKRKSEVPEDEDEGSPGKKAKSTFNGIAKGGILHDHMQSECERIAAKAGPADTTIDLTADDDVVFVKEAPNQNEEICLGVVPGKVNLGRVPTYSQKAMSAVGGDMWPKLRMEFRRERSQNNKIQLVDRLQRDCGYIDLKLANVLCPLIDGAERQKLRFTFYLDAHKKAKGEYAGQHISRHANVSIVMYCARQWGEAIGIALSKRGFWLNTPAQAGLQTGKEVINPHQPRYYGPRGQNGERRPQSSAPIAVQRTQEEMRREANTMFDGLVKHEDLPEMEADAAFIKTPLLAHQKQALHFLTDHERVHEGQTFSLWKPSVDHRGREKWTHIIAKQEVAKKPEPVLGGILADMMGLGKTLSILALIAETTQEAAEFGKQKRPDDMGVERNAKGTVIICPKSVMSNWSEQIRAHVVRDKLTYYNYHGSNRQQDLSELAKYDIILTTYNTAASDFNNKNKAMGKINWFRIVLDEAHQIRNQNTGVSKACIDLVAERRWAVTGTPVQNGLGDLGALIKFLRVHPLDESQVWSSRIIVPLKSGDTDVITHLRLLVDSITLRRMKDKIGLKERKELLVPIDLPEHDRKIYDHIAGTSRKEVMLMSGGPQGRLRGKTYAHILKAMGRMRQFCAHGLDMFSEEEGKEIAEGLDPDNAIAIDLGDEWDAEAYQFVTEKQAFDTLQMMNDTDADRCEHCTKKLIEDNPDDREEEDDETSDEEDDRGDTFGYLTPCIHPLCPDCNDYYTEQAAKDMTEDHWHHCPFCTAYVRYGLFEYSRKAYRDYVDAKAAMFKKRKGKNRDNSNYSGPSVKVQALLQDLAESAEESDNLPGDEPPIRSVVFSGWTTYLDLIEAALDEVGYSYLRLDGKMSVSQRTKVLDQFKSDPDKRVLLVSIKAGGQGLNFTAANHVYMMEPQYNPGVEQQAIDRVHRLGQKRDVVIKRFIIRDSIEEGIMELQRKKEDLAKFTLERKKMTREEEMKKRMEDLKALFR